MGGRQSDDRWGSDNDVGFAEGTRQSAVSGATQVAANTAEIAFYRTAIAKLQAKGFSCSVYLQALHALGVRS